MVPHSFPVRRMAGGAPGTSGSGSTPGVRIGSEEHKRLFCRVFVETHDPYRPEDLSWPDLAPPELARLRRLPIWEEALNTELETSVRITGAGEAERDPLLREAIQLQGHEERRHFRLLELVTERYGIPTRRRREPPAPSHPEFAFLGVGYAECIDSFFAFGLFALAERSGFFPRGLVALFEPVMQEEARHILFFANWAAYRRVNTPVWARPAHAFQSGLALSLNLVARARLALSMGGGPEAVDDNFMMNAREQFGGVTLPSFVELCLAENERRLGAYDPRLVRPRLAPRVARAVLRLSGPTSGGVPAGRRG